MCTLLLLELEWARHLLWSVLLPVQLLCDPLLRVLSRVLLLVEVEHVTLADPAPWKRVPPHLDGETSRQVRLRLLRDRL